MTTMQEDFEAWMHAECFQEPPSYCVDLAWAAWQAAHLAGQRAMQERVKTVCALSMIEAALDRRREAEAEADRVPQMHEKLATAIRALEVKP